MLIYIAQRIYNLKKKIMLAFFLQNNYNVRQQTILLLII